MWESSESINELSQALVAALGSLTEIKKGREAKVQMKSGGNYGYKYADLADTIQTVRPVLAAHGLVVMQNASTANPEFVLISTTVMHSSGQWIRFEPLALPSGRTAQETGSAISYGRRYHLQACLGLATEDDDGASAGQRTSGPRSRQTASEGTRTAPKAPSAPRTPEEGAIREILSELPRDTASAIKQAFVAKYGTLADLEPSQHPDALAWVEDKVRN